MANETHRAEVIIGAPPAVVYPYISDGDKIAAWAKDKKLSISFPRGTRAAVGMQIRFAIRLPTHPHWTVEIKELIENKAMKTDFIDGIFDGSLSFLLEATEENQTRLVHEAQLSPKGSFMKFAWDRAGRKIHGAKVKELLARIRQLAENEYQPASTEGGD